MKKLSFEKRLLLIACLIEGNSLRSTARIANVGFNTVLRFVPNVGKICADYQDRMLRNLKCQRIQCDEIWAFCGAKEKNTSPQRKSQRWGDLWTWTAICADTKLVPCWLVGERDARAAKIFMYELARRLNGETIQLTTDGLKAYIGAVDVAFGPNVNYSQLVKVFHGGDVPPDRVKYSPGPIKGILKVPITGEPDEDYVSTSYVERQNLTMRMSMRRFTRLTNGHSKKIENHDHSIALHFFHHNFCRVHSSLKTTPAIAAGVLDRKIELT